MQMVVAFSASLSSVFWSDLATALSRPVVGSSISASVASRRPYAISSRIVPFVNWADCETTLNSFRSEAPVTVEMSTPLMRIAPRVKWVYCFYRVGSRRPCTGRVVDLNRASWVRKTDL
jgi:hypothetical protein